MARADACLIVAGIAGGLALTLMLGVRLISPARYVQALGGGLVGLAMAKAALVLSGTDHG
ncbi:hypothetical protein [Brevundimonas sp.]|uniref:hypothetical protein n=1 Tax=Brevundimonas sp. TaxID=1871086 RepID=UPI0028AAF0B5|nr:hypothetical protein [Brevundimonas sp.]